ncbi:MAG: nicotinamide mononucleotide transporter [Bacteroidales bacterium]|nr:nicotinamide mononucleotide transporter [Bacteroidales bacterium]
MLGLLNALSWIQQNYVENLAVAAGLLYVFFTIKEKILLWLFGIISSGLYVFVFFKSGIYAYSALYVYYVVIGFYGWYNWARKPEETMEKESLLKIHYASTGLLWICIAVALVVTIPVYFVLKHFAGSDMALADALMTSGGMVATWMLTQKIIEQWLFWIAIDLLSMSVMIYKDLYPSAGLFLTYTVLAVIGYIQWKNELQKATPH